MLAERSEPVAHPSESNVLVYTSVKDRELEAAGYKACSLDDSWPPEIRQMAEESSELVLADPISFPYEAMSPAAWDVPLTIILPDGSEPEMLGDLLEGALLNRLTFFDRLVTDDDALWDHLKRRLILAEGQRLHRQHRDLRTLVGHLSFVSGLIEQADSAYERPLRQIDRWALRTVRNKRVHLIQRHALEQQVRAARDALPRGVGFRVGHFGIGVGRSLEIYRNARVTGIDSTVWVIDQARFNFSGTRFVLMGPDRATGLEPASCDLTVATHVLGVEPPERRRALIGEMWRVTRVGGRMVIVEDVCSGEGVDTRTLIHELTEITGGWAVVADVQSLCYDAAGRVGDGIIAVTRVGIPGSR